MNRCVGGWLSGVVLVVLGGSARVEAAPGLGEEVQRLDALDRQVVAMTRGFPSARPLSVVARARLSEYRKRSRDVLREVAVQGDAVMQRALTGLDFSAQLQAAMNHRTWPTERVELRSRAECRAEVGLGRHFARYAAAVAMKDELAAMLVLGEYQNALNCLSAWQVAVWTDVVGRTLREYEAGLDGAGYGKSGVANFRVAVFNMVLLTVDLAKHAGPNLAHRWAQAAAPEVTAAMVAERRSLYLFDPIDGLLVGLRADSIDLRLTELLRPTNIGTGACGFVEMLTAAEAGGSPTCGRGLGCKAPTGELLPRTPARSGGETPFGLKLDSLKPSNCGGAGGSGAAADLKGKGKGKGGGGGGGGLGPFGSGRITSGSIGGCAAAAAVASSWQQTTGTCTLRQAMGKQSFEVGKLPGTRGLPVRGFYGDGGCSDPLAVGAKDMNSESGAGTVDETERDFDEARRKSAAWLRSKEGQQYVVKAAKDTISAAEARDRQNHQIAGEAFPKERADYYQGLRDRAGKDGKILAEAAARAVETATLGDLSGKDAHGAAGTTDNATNQVQIDRDMHPDVGTMQSTLEHEAVHVVANVMNEMYKADLTHGGTTVRFNESDAHSATNAALRGGYVERFIDLVSEEAQEEMKRRAKGKGGRQRPGLDGPGACGAAAAAVADYMECHPGQAKPLPKTGGLTPSPGLGPPPEGPNTAAGRAFTSCLNAAGIGVAVGDDGALRARAQATSPTGCAAMKCGDGSVANVGGSGCKCTGADGLVFPDQFTTHLCQHSDACLRQPVLGGDATNFDPRTVKAIQEWLGAPTQPPKP